MHDNTYDGQDDDIITEQEEKVIKHIDEIYSVRTANGRLADWNKFSYDMSKYITSTIEKYGEHNADLVSLTDDPRILLWNILKYVLRMWRRKGKINDIYKIVHYAQMMHKMCDGDLTKCGITNEKGD